MTTQALTAHAVMAILLTALTIMTIVWALAGRNECNQAIKECQRELPRRQYCELVAVPRVEQEVEQ